MEESTPTTLLSVRLEKSGSGVEQAARTSPVLGSVTMTEPESEP